MCAQLERDVDIVPVTCRDNGDDIVDSAPIVLLPPLYIPRTFDEGTAERGDGHHVPIVPPPCDKSGEGQYVCWPCGRSSFWERISLSSSLGDVEVPCSGACGHDLQTCGDMGPAYEGVGGATFAPIVRSYPVPPKALGVTSPGFSSGLSGPRSRSPYLAASCACRNNSLSCFLFLSRMMRHTTQMMNRVPATLAVIAPILALATISSLLELDVDVEVAVFAILERVLVLVVVKVVKIPALVVVTVLDTFVTVPLVKNLSSDIANGVLVLEQDSCNRSHTFSRIWVP